MKLAYLLDTFPSNSETFLAREIEALRRRGLEIDIFAFHAGEGATEIPQSWAEKLSPRRWQSVGRHLDLSGFDHVHAGWANHLALVAQSAAKRTNIPWSFSAHARDLWVEGGDLKAKLASAKFATSCTLAGTRELQKFGSNVIYAPHGLELNHYKFKPWKPRERVHIVGVGRLVEKKGWFDAYEAVSHLDESLNPVLDGKAHARLVLVGDGPLFGLLQKRDYPLYKDSILRLHGALPHAQTIKVMRRCDCLILPSRRTSEGDRDGLANVLLEAAALGLPIVTTNAGSASDFVDETTGIMVEAGDVNALTSALTRIFSEPEQTKQRCELARRRVEERFDVDRNIEVLERLFRDQRV
ncbi:putative teichuronic acid biosynthesis glycosyltransferase TuaC [Abditibacteriota bacterium]|nr:putative teichuronic acid biosynthesis glycosyltransferase TuaC [Abditibacteriota bacterium]